MKISAGEENCCYDFTLYSSSGQKLLGERLIGNGDVSLIYLHMLPVFIFLF